MAQIPIKNSFFFCCKIIINGVFSDLNVSTSFQSNGMFNEGWTADFSPGLQWCPPGHCLGGTLPISQKKGWSSHHSVVIKT